MSMYQTVGRYHEERLPQAMQTRTSRVESCRTQGSPLMEPGAQVR